MLESVWLAQHGTLCRGISWERHSLEDLTIIAGCVGGRPLAAICRLLAEDYFGWSGMWQGSGCLSAVCIDYCTTLESLHSYMESCN